MRTAQALRAWLAEGFQGQGEAFSGEEEAEAELGHPPGETRPLRPSIPMPLVAAIVVWALAALVFRACVGSGGVTPATLEEIPSGRYEFTLVEDVRKTDFGLSARALVEVGERRCRVQVLMSADEEIVRDNRLLFAQECIVAQASFKGFPEEAAQRYEYEMLMARASLRDAEYAADQGPLAFLVHVRRWAVDHFEGMEGRGAALLRALLLGERSMLEEDGLYDSMKTVGLAHMVAVSGSHLAVISAMASTALEKTPLVRRARVVVLCVFYGSYMVLTGLSAPVVRSALMASIVAFSAWGGRRSSPLAALGVCVCVLLALHPDQVFSLSFYLSAASTLGVIVLTPLFSAWFLSATSGRARTLCEAFAMTNAASIPIFPVTACVFARLSLIAPLANFLAAPVFTVLLAGGLGCFALCATIPPLGREALSFLVGCADAFCAAAEVMARIPCAAIPFSMDVAPAVALTVAAFAALWFLWPLPRPRVMRTALGGIVAFLLISIAVTPRFAGDEIVMLDVGQGDAFLIRSQGTALLVDTGNQDERLLAALSRQSVAGLDGLVVTHHDDDHCGSLPVLDSLLAGKGRAYVAKEMLACPCDGCEELLENLARIIGPGDTQGLSCGDVLRVGRFSCEVVWPLAFEDEGGNADSLCLLVGYDADGDGASEFRTLLTGDAEVEQLDAMAGSADLRNIDVFKAGHHGSRAGLDEELAAHLSPEVVLISTGENNRYGHPAPEVLRLCEAAGASVFRTDEHGDVKCRFEKERIEVSVQNLR